MSKPVRGNAIASRKRSKSSKVVAALAAAASLHACQAFADSSTWLGGAGTWGDASKWSNGVPGTPVNNTPGTADVFIDNGNPVASSVDTGNNVYNIHSLAVDGGDSLSVDILELSGSLTLNGTLNISSGQNPYLYFDSGGSISGTGTIRLGSVYQSTLTNSNPTAAPLVIGSGITVQGSSIDNAIIFGYGSAAPIVNNGAFAGDYRLQAAVNNATLNGGNVYLQDLTNAASGTINVTALTGSSIANAGALIGGSATLTKFLNTGTTTLNGVSTLAGFTNAAGATLALTGGTTTFTTAPQNAGTIVLSGTATALVTGNFTSAQLPTRSWIQNGSNALAGVTGILDNTNSVLALNGTNNLLLGGGSTLRGGTVDASAGGRLVTQGVVTFDGATLAGGTNHALNVSQVSDNGLVLANATANFSNLSGTDSETFNPFVGGNGVFATNLSATSRAGISSLTIRAGVQVHASNLQLVYVDNAGLISIDTPNVIVNVTGPFLNSGTVSISSGSTFGTYVPTGVTNTGSLNFASNSFVKLTPGSKLTSTTPLTIPATVTLTGSATVSAALLIGGILSPNGNITSPTLNPIGTMNVVGDVTFTQGGAYVVNTAPAAGGTSSVSDLLQVTGNLDLSAPGTTLDLSGATYGTYVVATYTGQLTGQFASVTPTDTVSYATPGEVIAHVSPEPGSALAAAGLSALLLARRRPKRP